MNRQELNILQIIFVKKKFQKNVESELNSLKIITNDEYYRIKNIDKSNLDEIKSREAFVKTKKNNEKRWLTFVNKLKILYSSQRQTRFDDKDEWNDAFEQQIQFIIDVFKREIDNDAMRKKSVSKKTIKL